MTKSILIDTNILVYALNKSSLYYTESKQLIDGIYRESFKACLTSQILYELFAVITDSKKFPFALTPVAAFSLIDNNYLNDKFPIVQPKESTWRKVFDLAQQHQISAQNIFDIVLVATMIDNDVFRVLTYDLTNFQKFSFLEVIHPHDIISRIS